MAVGTTQHCPSTSVPCPPGHTVRGAFPKRPFDIPHPPLPPPITDPRLRPNPWFPRSAALYSTSLPGHYQQDVPKIHGFPRVGIPTLTQDGT